MNYWEDIDWEEEINACMTASLSAGTSDEDRTAFRMTVGRCILLMQEHLPQREYHKILININMPHSLQICFRDYLRYIGRMVKANPQEPQQPPEHTNCRCVWDEQGEQQ